MAGARLSTTQCSRCAREVQRPPTQFVPGRQRRVHLAHTHSPGVLVGEGTGHMADLGVVPPPHLGELEQAIMDIVWKRQQATVREVVGALARTPPLAYTTVATIMGRLVEKGLLARSRAGKVDLYRPAYDSVEFSRRAASAAVQQLVRE